MSLNYALIDYGDTSLTTAQIQTAATYQLFICSANMAQASLQAIKALNPNIILLCYFDLCWTAPNQPFYSQMQASWFLLDANGNRVNLGDDLLLDITNVNYQKAFQSFILQLLSNTVYNGFTLQLLSNTVYNGIYLDNVSNSFPTTADVSADYIANWHSNVKLFLQFIKTTMPSGFSMWINSDDFNDFDYINIADGEMFEGFFYGEWYGNNPPNGAARITILSQFAALGKPLLIEDSAPTGTSAIQTGIDALYCYSATLLGIQGGSCYFGFCLGAAYNFDVGTLYLPQNAALGSPSGSYTTDPSGFLMRKFSNGLVFLNPTANVITVTLPSGTYATPSGQTVLGATVTLSSYSGLVLLNATAPPSPPSASAPSGSISVGGTPYGGYMYLPAPLVRMLWRLRRKYIRPEVHKKLHPLV